MYECPPKGKKQITQKKMKHFFFFPRRKGLIAVDVFLGSKPKVFVSSFQ